jgi:hypothetical protein
MAMAVVVVAIREASEVVDQVGLNLIYLDIHILFIITADN